MHVLRIWLNSGTQIELLYRGIGDMRTAMHALQNADDFTHLRDDFGKDTVVRFQNVMGYQQSDYATELEGALEIARAKQLATEKHQREVAARHGVIGQGGPQMVPGNGRIVTG